ncbi:unnamed protein product [Medioppia subpectinata]|uniref:Angiogenic factor with G patch and FHA domains 1 n=1 Tax=Medioppia subpectinata TaxID=1979941 RepID=A0A7R9KRT6_9ACAR|nr:unnamed protein product [Medioppia subpectinata]CAG2108637.1 unnamed protein product [Medioppia subpectinata]
MASNGEEVDVLTKVSSNEDNDKQVIERLLREKEISLKHNNDLRHELSILSAKLQLHQNVVNIETKCVDTQTDWTLMDSESHNNDKETTLCPKCRQSLSCDKSVVLNDWKQNSETNNTRISDLVRETAQQVVTNNDFQNDYLYDQKSKTYYSRSSGWYYYPKKRRVLDKSENVNKNSETESIEIIVSSSEEEGEIDDSDDISIISDDSNDFDDFNEDKSEVSPPLVRMIVKNSSTLELGSLVMVTCMGAKIGNQSNCDVWITDESSHAEMRYNYEDNNYMIKDLNSTNGTFINGNKIETDCETVVKHCDEICFGKCVLLVHIHYGKDVTCDGCEPGLVIASLKSIGDQNTTNLYEQTDKESDRKRQLKTLKKKYGLKDVDFCEPKAPIITNTNYTDRAEKRRGEKGSDNPYEKTAAGTSLDSALLNSNKGFQMLSKMGWTSGQALGKNQNGIVEPINVINGDSKSQPSLQKEN